VSFVEQIKVKNFQSLRSVALDLGKLTVVVGPSSSGKTALIRALKGVACNLRGDGYVTHGEKFAAITVRTEHGIATLERGPNHGVYRVVGPTGLEEVFTKLAGKVPEEVTRVLGIDPFSITEGSVHFAGQFDRPYLLDATGSAVADVLGRLTNVDMVFAAVKKSLGQKNAIGAQLKVREADLAAIRTRMGGYAALGASLKACTAVEEELAEAEVLARRHALLTQAIGEAEIAAVVLARSALPVVPDLAEVERASARLEAFKTVVREWATGRSRAKAADIELVEAAEAVRGAEQQLHEKLIEAGRCPTCNQEVAE